MAEGGAGGDVPSDRLTLGSSLQLGQVGRVPAVVGPVQTPGRRAGRAGETLPGGGFPKLRTWCSVNAATWLNVGHCRRVQPLEQTSLNCPLIGVAESTIAEISAGGGINNPHSVSAALAPLLFPSLCLNLAHYYYFIKGPFLHPLPLEDTPQTDGKMARNNYEKHQWREGHLRGIKGLQLKLILGR